MAERIESLAEFLGVHNLPDAPRPQDLVSIDPALELEGKEFARAVLNSYNFRRYIVNSLELGTIPAAVLTRLMDFGWERPAKRVEHSGVNGQPIEVVSEVRRVIVRSHDFEEANDSPAASVTKH